MNDTPSHAYDPDFLAGRMLDVVGALEEGFAVLDAAGVIQFMNPATVRMFSVDVEGVLGQRLLELPWEIEGADGTQIPKEAHPSLLALADGTAHGPEVIGVTVPTLTEKLWLEVTARPLLAEDGEAVDGSVALFRDIGARRAAEHALRSSEHRFETLTSMVPVGIYQTDVNGQCIYANDAWCEIAGITPEEAVGDGWASALHPDDRERIWNEWETAAESGGEFRSEYRYKHGDGGVRWVIGAAIPHESVNGSPAGFLGSVTDVTEQKAAAMMKDQLIGLVSHELRAPLVAIGGALGHLEPQTADLDDHGRRLYDMAVRNTRFLERLVTEMLDIERMEGGVATLNRKSISALDIMSEAAELITAVQGDAGVTIEVLGGDSALRVDADHDRMLQVLANLLSNAVKSSGPGTRVTVEAERDQHEVVFAVRDQGRGVPEDLTERIFERFVRVEKGDETDHRGVGLGLAIARAIVTRHGGRIWVESTLGQGSAFYFTIPGAEPPA